MEEEVWTLEQWEDAIGDSNNWEIFKITPEMREQLGLKQEYSIRYVGEIVNGQTVEEVPKVPMLYKTFAGLRELTEIPLGLQKGLNYFIVEGCTNFNPSMESLEKYTDKFCSKCSIEPFANSGSPNMVDVRFLERVTPSYAISEIFKVSKDTVASVLKANDKKDEVDFFFDTKDFLEYLALMPDVVKPGIVKFSTGYTLSVEVVHKSSEMKYPAQVVEGWYTVTGQWSPVRLAEQNCYLYVLADDFMIDTDDEVLMNALGVQFKDTQLNHAYKAGENAELEVSGDCLIKADTCPLQASGTLTIKGSGSLVLECVSNMHACIGTATHTGMSYGRWEPGREKPLEKIIIDGVKVVCKSIIPNFSLGSYGESAIPEIECKNGGSIDCPESKGHRVMMRSGAEGLYGSTKREDLAVYEIESSKRSAKSLKAF